jgi:hypothetical protein
MGAANPTLSVFDPAPALHSRGMASASIMADIVNHSDDIFLEDRAHESIRSFFSMKPSKAVSVRQAVNDQSTVVDWAAVRSWASTSLILMKSKHSPAFSWKSRRMVCWNVSME